MHPQLIATLRAHTPYEDRRRELVSWLRRVAERYACRFDDLSQIATFAGDAQAFVDGVHPLETNTRRMIDRLTESLPRAERQGRSPLGRYRTPETIRSLGRSNSYQENQLLRVSRTDRDVVQ